MVAWIDTASPPQDANLVSPFLIDFGELIESRDRWSTVGTPKKMSAVGSINREFDGLNSTRCCEPSLRSERQQCSGRGAPQQTASDQRRAFGSRAAMQELVALLPSGQMTRAAMTGPRRPVICLRNRRDSAGPLNDQFPFKLSLHDLSRPAATSLKRVLAWIWRASAAGRLCPQRPAGVGPDKLTPTCPMHWFGFGFGTVLIWTEGTEPSSPRAMPSPLVQTASKASPGN